MRWGRAVGVLAAVAGSAMAGVAHAQGASRGVYLRLADAPGGRYAEMAAAVPALVERAGWRLLAQYDAGNGGCRFKARVFVVHSPNYAAAVLREGGAAAFALPLRLAVYEDEGGAHLALANPRSLARTIVKETGFDGPPEAVVTQLQAAMAAGFPGTPTATEYGQMRDRGLIGKTMGIVAGGPFPSKVETIASSKERSVAEVASAIVAAGGAPYGRWALRSVYRLDLPEHDMAIVGLTGDKVEAKSFSIVGEGADAARKGLSCPGLDHAPAYPVELMVRREDGATKVQLIDEMFRMKMYFEDAGNVKFASNMQMPGAIETEIRDLVEEAL